MASQAMCIQYEPQQFVPSAGRTAGCGSKFNIKTFLSAFNSSQQFFEESFRYLHSFKKTGFI
ncbi:MAG: hypothetical protein PHD36_03940 [Desulfotomaculaceae bacterium]|nr:hypothetical protein [Desulfotomaculaceae bacterium]